MQYRKIAGHRTFSMDAHWTTTCPKYVRENKDQCDIAPVANVHHLISASVVVVRANYAQFYHEEDKR
jgi:hypothetical protein